MTPPEVASTIAAGLVLGWSVAWPPGPVNAEMIRRGLTRGFRPAAAVGFGACTADFLWALAVAGGAGALAGLPGVRPVLAGVSLVLLLFLAWTFLSGACRAWQRSRRPAGHPAGPPSAGPGVKERFAGTRGGYLLGLTMAVVVAGLAHMIVGVCVAGLPLVILVYTFYRGSQSTVPRRGTAGAVHGTHERVGVIAIGVEAGRNLWWMKRAHGGS